MNAMLKRAFRSVLDRLGLELLRKDAPGRFVDPFAEIKHLGHPVRTIFDVGANVGDVALRLAREHPSATVHAFEPAADTFSRLRQNTQSIPRIRAHNLGLGATPGTKTMRLFEDSRLNTLADAAPFVTAFETPVQSTASIEISTLDMFARQHAIDSIDILKIDTEGFEMDVLEGGRQLLAGGRVRFVVSEVTEIRRAEGSSTPGFIEIHDYLAGFGFRLFMLQTDYVVPAKAYFAVRNALFVLP